MTLLHRYVGNPILSFILRVFFNSKTKDTHSGFRMIKRSALDRMHLSSSGMEIASEMILKAAKLKLKVKEVSISYYKRQGQSKMKSIRDGWKHLRLMLLYSPDYLYLGPGFASFLIGLIFLIIFMFGPLEINGLKFLIHPMFIASLLTILGYQIISLWLFSRIYLLTYLDDRDKKMDRLLSYMSLERGLVIGLILFLVGIIININTLIVWVNSHYGALYDLRASIFGLTLILLGLQTVFSSFYLSILGMKNEQKK